MLVLLLAACEGPPSPEPRRATLVLAVPQRGTWSAYGDSAERGARFAVGDRLDLRVVDDGDPATLAATAADPGVVGVIAHLHADRARAAGPGWSAAGMPVLQLASGDLPALPRLLPSPPTVGRCAAALVGTEPMTVRTGADPAHLAAGTALVEALPPGSEVQPLDEVALALEAERLRARAPSRVAWVGRSDSGARLLRLLRQGGGTTPFVAVDQYDAGWLDQLGVDAAGTLLVSPHRPVREPSFNEAWARSHPEPADAIATDAYEAATLMIAAWEAARDAGKPTRNGLAAALRTTTARGASGSFGLDASGEVTPTACGLFHFDGTRLVAEATWFSDTDVVVPLTPPPPPRRKAPRTAEGEWLRLERPAPPPDEPPG